MKLRMILNELKSDQSEGQSQVDIVITTPGRLVDHLHGTPGFTLQHLRYLVSSYLLIHSFLLKNKERKFESFLISLIFR
jgi:hypothetical protein